MAFPDFFFFLQSSSLLGSLHQRKLWNCSHSMWYEGGGEIQKVELFCLLPGVVDALEIIETSNFESFLKQNKTTH